MKVLLAPDETVPAVLWVCDCGEEFWTDPCGEENLVWNGKELIEKCPKCGKENER